MSDRIERELEAVSVALRTEIESRNTQRYRDLYICQQALAWASNPDVAKSPLDFINGSPSASEMPISVELNPEK